MLGGVSVRDCYDIVEGRYLKERTRTRDGRPEMHFLLTDSDRVLPVHIGGATRVIQWGARRSQGKGLPVSPCVQFADLQAGRLVALEPEQVVVRATRALDNDVWFDVRDGIHAVMIRDGQGILVVYPLVEPSSHYYQVMTGSEWMARPEVLRRA
jgi:hypothetical protein